MANVGSKGITRYEETLATDIISAAATGGDGLAWVVTAGGTAAEFTRAVAAGKGLHATAVTTAVTDQIVEFSGDTLMFTGQEGHSAVEIMLQLSDITNASFFFGFNDDTIEASGTRPAELSGTTFIGNSADGCIGILYDTDATNDELHCFWANGAVDTTTAIADLRMKGMAPTNAKWLYMKVEMQDRGSGKGVRATFLAVDHNGKSVEKVFNTSVDRDLPLCYYFGFENRSASIHTVYIKGVAWEQTIADM